MKVKEKKTVNMHDYRYKKFIKDTIKVLWETDEETEELEIYDSIREYCERFNVPVNVKHPLVQRYLTDVLKYSLYGGKRRGTK